MRHLRRVVLAKLLVTALLVSSCATVGGTRQFLGVKWPNEDHGGDSGRPAAPDALFFAGGFVLDGTLAQLKVPVVPRVALDALGAWVVRVPKWGGRTEAAHGIVLAGAFSDAWVRGILKVLRR